MGLSEIVARSNTFTRTTPARGLVSRSPRVHSPALTSSFGTTILALAGPILTRPRRGLTVSDSAVPTAPSRTTSSLTLRVVASSSLARAVTSITTRSQWKRCALFIRLDGLNDRGSLFPGNMSQWYIHGRLRTVGYVRSVLGMNHDLSWAGGNYTNTVVQNNTILGGFASNGPKSPTQPRGDNDRHAIIKSVAAVPRSSPPTY